MTSMKLDLKVEHSVDIKRKKPWPTIKWLGEKCEDVFVLDGQRVSTLFLKNGETKRKTPKLKHELESATVVATSRNGAFLVGLQKKGNLFLWHKDNDILRHITGVPDILSSTLVTAADKEDKAETTKPSLFVSDDACQVLLIVGNSKLYLWEMKNKASLFHSKDPNLLGKWSHISAGDTKLPPSTSKDVVIDAVFFSDLVLGRCCSCSFVFNFGSSIQISAVLLRWLNQSSIFSSREPTYSAEWTSLRTPLSSLGASCSPILHRGAYVARHTNDGSTLAIAINQQVPQNNKMMFVSTMTSTAVVSDMKNCGCKSKNPPTQLARSYRVGSMEWTINSLFLVCITMRGSVCIFSRLGELLVLQAEGCSVEFGPAHFLPFHPVITIRTKNTEDQYGNSDSSESDPMKQRFSVTTHPSQPMILCSDGYLVTVLSLPADLTCEATIEQFLIEGHDTLSKLNDQLQLGLTIKPLVFTKMVKPKAVEMLVSPNQNNSHPFPSLKRSAFFGFRKPETLNLAADIIDGREKSALTASSDFSDYGKPFDSINEGKIVFGTMDSIDGRVETSTDFNELFVLVKKAHRAILSAWGLGVSVTDKWSLQLESLMQHTAHLISLLMQVLMKCDDNLLRTDSTNYFNNNFSKLAKRYPHIFRVLHLFKCTMSLLHWDTLHKNLLPHMLKLIHEVIQHMLTSNSGRKKHVNAFAGLFRLLHYSEFQINSIYSYKSVVQPSFDFAHLERKFYESDVMESAVFQNIASHQDVEKDVPVARLKAIATIQEILDQTKSLRGSLTRSLWHPGTKVASRHLPAKRLMMSWKLLHQKLTSFYSELSHQAKQTPQDDKVQKQIEKLHILFAFTQTSLAKLGCSIPVIFNKRRSQTRRKIFLKGCESFMFAKKTCALDFWRTSYIRTQAVNVDNRKQISVSRHSVASDSLLAILYTYILNFDLISAIEMIDSLVECYSLEENSVKEKVPRLTRARVSFLFALMGGKQDDETTSPPVLPCVIEPAAKIAVATLARFMAMYFSNQSLFVYPPYNPQPLPRLDSPEKNIDNRRIAVYHDQVSVAIRKSDLSDVFTVNFTLQLLLVCGLHWEAIWFAKQLGDWKSSLVLAVIANEHNALQKKMVKNSAMPVDLHPLSIVKENLMHVIQQSQYTAPQQQNVSNNHKTQFKSSPTRLHTSVKKSLSIASLTEADKALHEQLSRSTKEILTAATVAKLDVTPWLLCQLMQKCLAMVAKFDRLVPDDFYLPAPPYFCPQPSLGIEVTYCEAVQDEYELRRETSDIIQLILLVLSASNCTMPCSRWYVQELIKAQEKLVDQDQDTTCDFPTMLASYTTCPVDFKALLMNSDPTRHSTKLLLQCFRDICTIVWLLNVRDKLTMAVRKYRVIQENVCSFLNTSSTLQQKSTKSVLQDIIQWSKFLHSFSFFLNMEDEVQDILLTAVSNLPPSKDVAEVLGEVFYSSKIVLPAVEEKFQRVMTKLKKKKEKADERAGKKKDSTTVTLEPLYVYYRKQCLKQKRSLISKTKILGSVEEQILGIYCTPPKSKETIEKQLSKASTFKVGARSFETNKVFLDFLETFFLVAFGKFDESVSFHGIKRTDNIPLLRSYADEIRQHELSTLAFGIVKPQHCVELSDAILLRSQSFENLSKSFSLTRSGKHETGGCSPSKVKGLFRSKQSYFFKKKMLPSIELLSTLNYKGTEQEVVDDLEKDERPVSRLSQNASLGFQKNQSVDDIRAVSRMSSLSSSRVSRSSLTKLRSSKGSLMLGLDGQKLFLDVNVVPGEVYNEMVLVQQWMSRWSKKRLPFDTHSSSETTERAIRVELPQQLLVNCMWLIENWYSLEKTKSTNGTVVDDVDGIDQGKKNRRLGVAMRPDQNKENSNVVAKDKMSKSKITMKKRSKSSQSLEIRSNNIEAELKKPDGEDQETKSRSSKNNKKKRNKYKKSSKTTESLEIHSVISQVSEDASKLKEKEVQEIVEKKLKKSDSDFDEIDKEKIKKSSRLRKQQTHEISTETSLKLKDDERTTTAMNLRNIQQDKPDTDQHNVLYRRSPVTGAVQTLTATHYYHSGEDSDSSTRSLTEKDVAKSLSETDLHQLDALERKHSIPQSPLVSPCASINRQHSDQTIGFRKLVRAELKKLLEAQHKNTMTMLDTSGLYSGDAHPLLQAYSDSHHAKGIDEENSKTLQRTKHPSGRDYSTSGRSVKAVLARRTTIPSLLSSSSSSESTSEVNKGSGVPAKPSSKTASKLFLTRSQSSEKNRTFGASNSPSGNRNQNAVHSPEELDDIKDFPLNDEVFSWMITSDEFDIKEPQYQRDSLGRPLPGSGFRNPSFQDDGSFNQYSDINEVSSPLNIEDLKNQEVETLQDVKQIDIQQNGSVQQNEVQGWPLLSFINSDSIPGKSFPEFEGHQHPKTIPTQPRQISSQPFRLGQPFADTLPPVAPRSVWHHQKIHSDPDISNEYVAGFPLLKLKQYSGDVPGLLPVQQQDLQNNERMFNFEPESAKDAYSSIWIPPLLHLDRPSRYYQAHSNASDFPHNSGNVKDMSRRVESDTQSDYDSIWIPPLLHLDKQMRDNHESYVSKHLQHFWAKEKNIHSLKLRLREKHPHEVDPIQHTDNKEDPPDKVSMPLLHIQPKVDSDESHTRRRRRQPHRVSPKDEDTSSQKSSSSCRSDSKIQPKQNAQKANRRKLPKEPTKRSKESKKATKDQEKKEILIPVVKNETQRNTDVTLSPSEESKSQPEDVLNEVKLQRNLHEKGSYDHLLEGRQESYFPSSAEVHLKAVRGIQPKQVERVDVATMATEMKNAQTSIDFDRLVKLPEDNENTLILDQDGQAINDAISAYTTAKTGLDNAGKILAPDIFFNLRFERTSENRATSPDTEASQAGRNFISVVDLEGSRLLDDIPIRKQPTPEIIQDQRSQQPSIASVHYSALRNREKEPSLTSPHEVPEVNSPTRPDPLTKEILAARKRLKKEQFLNIKAISDEEREGYRKRMNMQLMEMDEQLKVIDEMSRQMEEDLQGTNKLMKNVETITDFLTPQQPHKKVQILDALSDSEKKETLVDKQRIEPSPENKQGDKLKISRLPGDEQEADMPEILLEDNEAAVEENHEGQEKNVTITDGKKKDDLAISRIDTTLDDTHNTLGISGISGVSDIIAEVIVDGDLNATALGISEEQRNAARRRIERQKVKIDEKDEDLDFASLDSKQIRELLKTPREEDDEKEPWPSAVQPSKRTEQQQKELKEWTKKKREKAIADYRNKLSELREMEKTPFKAQNTSTLKELQKAEIERQNKRKTKEEEDYDERVKHAKSLMDQLFVEQTQLKTVTDKPPEARVKKVPPKPLAKPTRTGSQSKRSHQRAEKLRNVRSEVYEDDRRNSRIDPDYYLKLRDSFEQGVPLQSSSTNDGNTKRKSSIQMILEKKEKKMLEELGKLSDLSSSSDDLDPTLENDKENQIHTSSADDAPVMYKPKPFTALVKLQRPAVTRKGQDVPRTAKTYTEMLQDLKKENINPSNKNQSVRSQQRLYGTKRLPGSSRLREQQSPRHPKTYTQRLQEMKKMSNRPAGMRSRTPIKPPASRGLTETVTLGETRRQQVERRGLKAEGKPRVSTPYTERLLQLSGTYTAGEAVVSPQPKLGLPYKPKEKLGSTYVNRLKQANEGAIKSPYQAVYEPVPRGTYRAYKAPPLRSPSPRHHPYREKRSYDFEDQSVSEASPWSLSDSVKRILGEDDSMAGISASVYPSDDELGDVYPDDQYSEYTLSVNIKELEEIASVGSASILSFEWDAIDKMVADVK